MAAGMSASLFARWKLFCNEEPFGYRAEWFRFAMVAAVTVNSNPFRGGPAAKPADFMPKPPASLELLEKLAKAQAFAEATLRKARASNGKQ